MGRVNRVRAAAAIVLSIPLSIVNAVPLYGVRFARPVADDFCTIGSLRRLGFLRSQVHWYESWSGRYAFTASVNAVELLGHWSYPWVIGIIMTVWLIAMYFLFKGVLSWADLSPTQAPAVLLSLLSAFALFSGVPNFYQSFYWLTGFLTYALPMILLTLLAGWAVQIGRASHKERPQKQPIPLQITALLFGLLVGGFSETTTLVAALLLGLGIGAALSTSRWRHSPLTLTLLPVFVGVLAGAVIQISSPGNQVRQALMPSPPDISTLIRWSVRDVVIFLAILRRESPLILTLALIIPVFVGLASGPRARSPSSRARWPKIAVELFAIPAAAAVLILTPFAATEYAQSSYPDGRVLLVPYYLLLFGISVWSLLLGKRLNEVFIHGSKWRNVGLVLLFVVAFVLVILSTSGQLLGHLITFRDAESFSGQWDVRHSNVLRASGGDNEPPIEVASLPHIGGVSEISREADNWVNRCFAQAYGLPSVVAK